MKHLKIFGAVFASVFALQVSAVTLTVEPLTGTKMTKAIEGIGSLVFGDEDHATLYAVDRTVLATYDLDQVRKLFFTDGNGVEEVVNSRRFAIYPNPTTEELQVSGVDERTQIHIVDLNGRVLQSISGTTIDVSTLASGVYNLIVDGEVFRFIKK